MKFARINRQTWFLLALCCLIYVSFGVARALSLSMQADADIVTLVNKNESWTQEEIELMKETERQQENPASFCVWSEQENQLVKNKDFDRSQELMTIFVFGNAALIDKDYRGLSAEDAGGCLIDQTSAYALFGSQNVVGQIIEYQDCSLIVRGVLPQTEQLLIVNMTEFGETGRMISLQPPKTVDATAFTDLFCSRHGIYVNRMDNSLFSMVAQLLSCLFPLLMTGFAASPFFHYANHNRNFPVKALCMAAFGLILVVVFLALLQIKWTVSASMLPTKQSDFEFWSNLWKQQQEAFLFFMRSKKTRTQVNVCYQFLGVIICNLTAIVGAVYLRRRLLMDTWRRVFWGSLLTFCCAFFVCLLFVKVNVAVYKDIGLWLFGVAYCAVGKMASDLSKADGYQLSFHKL